MAAMLADDGFPEVCVESDGPPDLVAGIYEEERSRTLEELARLFQEYRPRLLKMVRARLGPQLRIRVGEDDVLHNAYIRAQRAWLRQRPSPEGVFVWLYGKTWSELIDQIRKIDTEKRDKEREVPWPDESVAEMGQRLGLSTYLGLKDTVELVQRSLTAIEFEIIWMHSVDDLTFPDIASILTAKYGEPVTHEAVRKRYLRAVEKAQMKTRNPFSTSSTGQEKGPGHVG